jgi:tetratricopeptide (TPR) repeat protein
MKAVGVTWPPIEVETHQVAAPEVAGKRRWLRLLLAGAAESFFFVGLLAAVGLVALGLALLLLVLAAATVAGAAWLLRRRPRVHRPRSLALPRPRVSVGRPVALVANGLAATRRAGRNAATRVTPVVARAGAAAVTGAKRGAAQVGPASAKLRQSSTAASKRLADRAQELRSSPPSPERLLGAFEAAKGRALATPDVHAQFQEQEALRLNALGSKLRRTGDADGAAEQHRAALHFFRALGDRRAEALTLNNVGLALASGGEDGTAVEHFEAAAGILDELDDRHHEGQVLANLGATHLRHGRADEATELLQRALEKLEPASPAARQVEEQLRRAS